MAYLIAKDIGRDGCLALNVKLGRQLVQFKREITERIGCDSIELVTISRPSAFVEYEPYTFFDTREEFMNALEKTFGYSKNRVKVWKTK